VSEGAEPTKARAADCIDFYRHLIQKETFMNKHKRGGHFNVPQVRSKALSALSEQQRTMCHVTKPPTASNITCTLQIKEHEMGGVRSTYRRDDICINARKILKWVLENRTVRCGLDASGSEQGPVAGCCEHSTEHWRFTKGGEFLH
jgi:hypothetical protein